MAILKTEIANTRTHCDSLYRFCHHYWSFWQLYDNSMDSLKKKSCIQYLCYYSIHTAHRKPHKQQRQTKKRDAIIIHKPKNMIEWISFISCSRHFFFISRRKDTKFGELWRLIKREERGKKCREPYDLEIILWKSGKTAVAICLVRNALRAPAAAKFLSGPVWQTKDRHSHTQMFTNASIELNASRILCCVYACAFICCWSCANRLNCCRLNRWDF